jgi:hypothetical protein
MKAGANLHDDCHLKRCTARHRIERDVRRGRNYILARWRRLRRDPRRQISHTGDTE